MSQKVQRGSGLIAAASIFCVSPSGLTAVTEKVVLHGNCVDPDGIRTVSTLLAVLYRRG